jgi:hypothetical protein
LDSKKSKGFFGWCENTLAYYIAGAVNSKVVGLALKKLELNTIGI